MGEPEGVEMMVPMGLNVVGGWVSLKGGDYGPKGAKCGWVSLKGWK